MNLPLLTARERKKPTQVIAIDLGAGTTKAVHIQRRGENLSLLNHTILPAPESNREVAPAVLADHLKRIGETLNAQTKTVAISFNSNAAIVRMVETQLMTPADLRQVLKLNPRIYLQLDLPDHLFDCQVIRCYAQAGDGQAKGLPSGAQKQQVLVAGVPRRVVDALVAGATGANLMPLHIMPGILATVNAFQSAVPERFSRDAVALIDVGFRSSSICILDQGELALSRTIPTGGDCVTKSLSQALNVSYAEAESIKIGIPEEVRPTMESCLGSLGRELRASLDCFEHQRDKFVSGAFLTGASISSELILDVLQGELRIQCEVWDPTAQLHLGLTPAHEGELRLHASQLSAAIGVALAVL